MAPGTTAGPLLDEPVLDLTARPPAVPPGSAEGPSPLGSPPRKEPVIGNACLGMLMFLAFEAMFFGGLIGAFLVFRLSSLDWPPPGQPTLPVGVTWVTTVSLLWSGRTMQRALRAIRGGSRSGLVRGLGLTAGLGTIFLVVQGSEWVRLVRFGLTLQSSTYGATFYTLIGCHGLHVLGAVVWLLTVLLQAKRGRFSPERHVGIQLCRMYWLFVVGLWVVLFPLVYLM